MSVRVGFVDNLAKDPAMVGRSSVNTRNSQANNITYCKGIYFVPLLISTRNLIAIYYCTLSDLCKHHIGIR